jgi:hypothetical protein
MLRGANTEGGKNRSKHYYLEALDILMTIFWKFVTFLVHLLSPF